MAYRIARIGRSRQANVLLLSCAVILLGAVLASALEKYAGINSAYAGGIKWAFAAYIVTWYAVRGHRLRLRYAALTAAVAGAFMYAVKRFLALSMLGTQS